MTAALLLLLLGCDPDPVDTTAEPATDSAEPVDLDGDGWTDQDCDDVNPEVNPDATELCDGVDNDCDGMTDDPDSEGCTTYYLDQDGDRYAAEDAGTACLCTPDAPYTATQTGDCDDTDAALYDDAHPCHTTAEFTTEDAAWSFYGGGPEDDAGWTVSGAGDLTGDGLPDLVIVAPSDDTLSDNGGAVYIIAGPATGSLGPRSATATIFGDIEDADLGFSVAAGMDLDGDGAGDLAAGQDGYPTEAGLNTGALCVVTGPLSGTISAADGCNSKWIGESGEFGKAITAAGDQDEDGADDLLVTAPSYGEGGENLGRVYLISSSTLWDGSLDDALWSATGLVRADYAGISVAAGRDVTGDGRPDLLIGASGEDSAGDGAGAVYLHAGRPDADETLDDADARWLGRSASAQTGRSVAMAGDADGDGLDDVLIGAYSERVDTMFSPGVAYLVPGSVTGTQSLSDASANFIGEESNAWAGFTLDGAGDVNADSYGDVIIGAPWDSARAYLIYGPAGGSYDLADADVVFQDADGAFALFGYDVAGTGDVTGDDLPDLLIGAPWTLVDGVQTGGAFLFDGASL